MPTSIPINPTSESKVSSRRAPAIFIALPLLALLIALFVAVHEERPANDEAIAVTQSLSL